MMENNNTTDILELEDMRKQMQALRTQLETQIKVNDDLMLRQLKKRANSFVNLTVGLAIFELILIYPTYFYYKLYDISTLCFIAMVACILVDASFNLYTTFGVRAKGFAQGNLIQTLHGLIRIKRISQVYLIVEVVVCTLIFIWIFFDTVENNVYLNLSSAQKDLFVYVYLIGAAIGYSISLKLYRKYTRNLDEMIEITESQQKSQTTEKQ